MTASSSEADQVRDFQKRIIDEGANTDASELPLPRLEDIRSAERTIVQQLPDEGLGITETLSRIDSLRKGLYNANQSSLYYGFVVGGINPAAAAAETLVSAADQNVHVHLPDETVTTTVEFQALKMLCQLFDLDTATFQHRIFTTGATASNVLGLACGREHVLRLRDPSISVGDLGLTQALRRVSVDDIQILTALPHSTLAKAASIVGLGRDSVHSLVQYPQNLAFDWEKLEEMLQKPRTASIIAVSCAEINTGFFTLGMRKLRGLADKYKAYIHVDAAFGLSARCLRHLPPGGTTIDRNSIRSILEGCEDIELADSITGDAHKLLNVVS